MTIWAKIEFAERINKKTLKELIPLVFFLLNNPAGFNCYKNHNIVRN